MYRTGSRFPRRLLILTICFLICIELVVPARILGVVPTPSYSHQIVFRPLWAELASRGHQVVVLTTDPVQNASLKNLREIDLNFVYKNYWNTSSLFSASEKGMAEGIDAFFTTMIDIMDAQLNHSEVKALIRDENESFDVVIVEFLFPIMFGFGKRFNCPTIGMTTFDAPNGIYKRMGNPIHPILNPDVGLPYVGKLNFMERVVSVLFDLISGLLLITYRPRMLDVVHQHFGEEITSLDELLNTISLLFVNADPVLSTVRPLVPAIIQIGGAAHLNNPKPLPEDLKEILDNATQGFIYFSLGTNMKVVDLPKRFLEDVLLTTFAALPYKILWKFDSDNFPMKPPSNVIIRKWLPQQDVLKHSNIKAFITQCGKQSIDEAFYSKVPIVGIPVLGDQGNNARQIVYKGLGVSVDYKTVTSEELTAKILDAAQNLTYRDQLQRLTALAQDQPMTGLEKAVWWTEYVVRNKGASHLRSPSLDMPSYQYFLLDVLAFLFAVLIFLCFILHKIVQFVCKKVASYMKPKRD